MSSIVIIAIISLKRKCSSYNAAFKLKVMEFADVNGNGAAEREYSASKGCRILKKTERMACMQREGAPYPEMDDVLCTR